MNKKNFLFGFFIGGITATISTLITAPSSGKETRKAIKENTDVWLTSLAEVKESLQFLNTTLKTAAVDSSDTIRSFVSDIKTALSQWKKEILPHQHELQKELASIEQSIQALEVQLKQKSNSNLMDTNTDNL